MAGLCRILRLLVTLLLAAFMGQDRGNMVTKHSWYTHPAGRVSLI